LNAVHTRYIIKNDTGYVMKVMAYYNSKLYDEIIISPDDAFVKEVIWEGDNAENSIFDKTLNPGLDPIRDSVVIIFDNRRVIVQHCMKLTDLTRCGSQASGGELIEKNIATFTSGSGNQVDLGISRKGLKKRTGPFVITFENSDYERAVEL
jgi:hypothetical protein